jgi:hypothetical protein
VSASREPSRLIKPTFTGSVPVIVAGLRWGVPPGSLATANGAGFVFVVIDGLAHVLTRKGTKVMEVALEADTARVVAEQIWNQSHHRTG